MATLSREIEIVENWTPEPNRVRIKIVVTNIHNINYEKLKKDMVKSGKNDFDFFLV